MSVDPQQEGEETTHIRKNEIAAFTMDKQFRYFMGYLQQNKLVRKILSEKHKEGWQNHGPGIIWIPPYINEATNQTELVSKFDENAQIRMLSHEEVTRHVKFVTDSELLKIFGSFWKSHSSRMYLMYTLDC